MLQWLRRLLYLPEQASSYAAEHDLLHFSLVITSGVGTGIISLVILYYVVRYLRRGTLRPTPRLVTPVPLEVVLIGGTLSLFLVWWVVGFIQYVHMRDAPAAVDDVYVTGKQWMWKFAYPNGRTSIGVLTVPKGRPIRLVMTSRDVIHSFFVPAFRMKQDAVPGRYTTAWFTATQAGRFDAFCAEYCGTSHSRMLAQVVVLEAQDYQRWLRGGAPFELEGPTNVPLEDDAAAPPRLLGTLAEQGRQVAARQGCLSCHTIDGQPHIGPTWKGLVGKVEALASGRTVLVDPAYLTKSMMEPNADVVAGYQSVMPTYRGLLDAGEVAALIEFMKSLDPAAIPPAVNLPAVKVEETPRQVPEPTLR